MLDSRRLQVLATVVEAGSITAAANVLGYTASAISQNITALERECGVALLEKAGRGIRPTQAGLLLAEHAEAVVARLQEAEAALKALRAGEAGRLRLAAFSTAGASLVPRAMARFRAIHRAVELDLAVAEDDAALAALRAGRIDLAVVAYDDPWQPEAAEDLVRTHVLTDPFRVIVPRDHRLAGRRTISLADLAEDPWIATASARCSARAVVVGACADVGVTPRFAIEAEEFATAVGFVGAGLGVTLVPLLALGAVPDTVRVRPVRGREPSRSVYAVSRRSNAQDPTVAAMVRALSESARSFAPQAA
jgi:DNA-binding transcriptional LysR family regulator